MGTLELKNRQYIRLKHPYIEHAIFIMWDYSKRLLTIQSDRNLKSFHQNKIADLRKFEYILLNPDMEGYQWKYKINYNNTLKVIELELIEIPKFTKGDLIIKDKQKSSLSQI